MTRPSRRQRLEQIEGYAKTLVHAVLVMDERRHILQPLLRDEEVRRALGDKFRNTLGAHAYNHLAPLIAQDLVRDLARLFLDDDRRAGSLINLYRKVHQSSIKRALRDKFARISDKWHHKPSPIPGFSEKDLEPLRERWRDKDREDFEASFDKGWATVSKAIGDLERDPVAAKIKTFRDKYHAHLEMAPLGKDPGPFEVASLGLTYNDLLDFADRYMGSVFELTRILTGSVFVVEGFSQAHREYGSDMWRILAGLEKQSQETN